MNETGGEREVYLSSADWMPRNLYKRVELMFPIKDERLSRAVQNVLELQWNDTQKCRHAQADGSYALPARSAEGRNAQETLLSDIDGVYEGRYTAREAL